MRDITKRLHEINSRKHDPNVFDKEKLIKEVESRIASSSSSKVKIGTNALGSLAGGLGAAGGMFGSTSLASSGVMVSAITKGIQKAAELSAKKEQATKQLLKETKEATKAEIKATKAISAQPFKPPVDDKPRRESTTINPIAFNPPAEMVNDSPAIKHLASIDEKVGNLSNVSEDQLDSSEKLRKEQERENKRQEQERDKSKEDRLEAKKPKTGESMLSKAAKSTTDFSTGALATAGGFFNSETLLSAGIALKALADFVPKLGNFAKALPAALGLLTPGGMVATAIGALGYAAFKKFSKESGMNKLEEAGFVESNAIFDRDKLNFDKIENDPSFTIDQARFLVENANLGRDDRKRLIQILKKRGFTGDFLTDEIADLAEDNRRARQRIENRRGIGLDVVGDAPAQNLDAQLERNKRRGMGAQTSSETHNSMSTNVNSPTTNINIGGDRPNSRHDRLRQRSRAGMH